MPNLLLKRGKVNVFQVSILIRPPRRFLPRRDEFWVGSRGPMTEKAILPSDDRTYGIEKTSESEDLVETSSSFILKTPLSSMLT